MPDPAGAVGRLGAAAAQGMEHPPAPPRLGFDDGRLRKFFALVPGLYAAEQARVQPQYQGLLYSVEHPLAEDTTDRIEAAFGLPHPQWTRESRREGIAALDGLRYPDTRPLASLRAVPGLDLRTLSHYLHFFHHAYPIYSEAACRGLARLGVQVPYVRERDPDVYALYITAVEELKERVPFWDVPETNVYLTRIVQAALEAYGSGVSADGPAPARAPPSASPRSP